MARTKRALDAVPLIAVGVVGLLLAGCSSGGSTGGSGGSSTRPASVAASDGASVPAAASPSATAEVRETFTSARHRYSISVPEGWRVKEYGGTWESLDQFSPGSEVPGEDVVGPIGLAAFLVMDSMPIPEGMTPEEWSVEFADRVLSGLPENCPGSQREGQVAGEPATVIEEPCGRAVAVGRSLVHGDRGYYFTTMHTDDDAESKAILDELVGSITFTN